MIWFTADEHYGHSNIIKYCNRPFVNVAKMQKLLIERHNSVVNQNDTVYLGDFCLKDYDYAEDIINRLNGNNVFIQGSHDRWIGNKGKQILEINVEGQHIVLCHYAMLVWPRSHYNSWQLFGHSHGGLSNGLLHGKQLDVGVDTNRFYPYSFGLIKQEMENKPDNFNLVKK